MPAASPSRGLGLRRGTARAATNSCAARTSASACASSARRAPASCARHQARPGHRRERHRGDELRVVAPAVALVGVGPAPVEHVFAVASASSGRAGSAPTSCAPSTTRSRSAASSRSRGDAQPVACSAARNACDRNGWPRGKRVPGPAQSRASATSSRITGDATTGIGVAPNGIGERMTIGFSRVAARSSSALRC